MNTKDVMRELLSEAEKDGEFKSEEDFQIRMQAALERHNNKGNDDFDGLSAITMHTLLSKEKESTIIKINPDMFDGNDVPLIQQIRYYLNLMKDGNEIKLTQTGRLPTAIVKELCRYIREAQDYIESNGLKVVSERDIHQISVMRFFCERAGLVKKRNNKISITAKGKKIMDTYQLFDIIFNVVFSEYNWGAIDCYEDKRIGLVGSNYTLYLLDKYGHEWLSYQFYSEKYYRAFPQLNSMEDGRLTHCYEVRTFERVLSYYGFVEIDKKDYSNKLVKTTDLFKKYLRIVI